MSVYISELAELAHEQGLPIPALCTNTPQSDVVKRGQSVEATQVLDFAAVPAPLTNTSRLDVMKRRQMEEVTCPQVMNVAYIKPEGKDTGQSTGKSLIFLLAREVGSPTNHPGSRRRQEWTVH